MTDPHHIEAVYNAGRDDEPYWQVVCSCTWEAWNQPSELAAREIHSEHRAELLLTGSCSCVTCAAHRRRSA